MGKYRHVLLTGSPGCGKTTLMIKICAQLQERKVSLTGFYTKEVREGRKRQGFDAVTMDGKTGVLARLRELTPAHKQRGLPSVGQYLVDLESFDGVVCDTLKLQREKQLYIVDEIGKMELFSNRFTKLVNDLFSSEVSTVLGTIPVPKGKPLKVVADLRNRDDIKIFEVTRDNRDSLEEVIIEHVESALSS